MSYSDAGDSGFTSGTGRTTGTGTTGYTGVSDHSRGVRNQDSSWLDVVWAYCCDDYPERKYAEPTSDEESEATGDFSEVTDKVDPWAFMENRERIDDRLFRSEREKREFLRFQRWRNARGDPQHSPSPMMSSDELSMVPLESDSCSSERREENQQESSGFDFYTDTANDLGYNSERHHDHPREVLMRRPSRDGVSRLRRSPSRSTPPKSRLQRPRNPRRNDNSNQARQQPINVSSKRELPPRPPAKNKGKVRLQVGNKASMDSTHEHSIGQAKVKSTKQTKKNKNKGKKTTKAKPSSSNQTSTGEADEKVPGKEHTVPTVPASQSHASNSNMRAHDAQAQRKVGVEQNPVEKKAKPFGVHSLLPRKRFEMPLFRRARSFDGVLQSDTGASTVSQTTEQPPYNNRSDGTTEEEQRGAMETSAEETQANRELACNTNDTKTPLVGSDSTSFHDIVPNPSSRSGRFQGSAIFHTKSSVTFEENDEECSPAVSQTKEMKPTTPGKQENTHDKHPDPLTSPQTNNTENSEMKGTMFGKKGGGASVASLDRPWWRSKAPTGYKREANSVC